MKKSLLVITLFAVVFSAGAVTVTDNFDRTDTTYSTNGTDIGSDWFVSSPENDWQVWRVQSNALESDIGGAGGQSMLLYSGMEVVAGGGSSFSMSADVKAGEGYTNAWGGICFHYQNPSNYYALRIQFEDFDYQLLKVKDGGVSTLISKNNASHVFSLTNFYTLSVSSDAAGVFNCSIIEEGSGTVMNPTDVGIDSDAFSGGYAGLYNTSKNTNPDFIYDNFSLEVSMLSGQIAADDFNRADTLFITNDVDVAANIGLDWVNAADRGAWVITNNTLGVDTITQPAILFNTGLETISGNGTNFMLRGDVAGALSGAWAGLVFNYQNPSNYYTVRLKPGTTSYQFLTVVDGLNDNYISKSDASVTFAAGTLYTITVTSDSEHTFGFTITELGSSDILNPTQVAADNNQRYTGGYAGFYTPTTSAVVPIVTYDNFLLNVDVLPGTLVTDDFNRADVAYTTDGSAIRSDWAASGGDWGITGSQLAYTADVSGGDDVLYNTSGETVSNTNGYGFMVRADVKPGRSGAWGGVVFNYQTADDFYMVRIKGNDTSYQLLSCVGGTISTIISKSDATSIFDVNKFYTVTVISTNAYEFDVEIVEKGTSDVLNPFDHGVDSSEAFTGGYAGVYCTSSGSPSFSYDNFVLQLIDPAPTEIGDVSILIDGANAVFSWPGDANGTYILQSRTSLVSGAWGNVVENIGGVDGTMYATNGISAAQAFYRVVVE